MLKICHVSSAHSRYDVRILRKECASLAKKGNYEVYFIVNDNLPNEMVDNVHIVSTGFKPNGRRERMFASMKYILSKAKEIDAEIYHFHDPELMQIFSEIKKWKKKIIFDSHEDVVEQITDKEWIHPLLRRIISNMFAIYQKSKLKQCDAVITVTPHLVEKLARYNQNTHMITNYPILNIRKNTSKKTINKQVFFGGGINDQWCHEYIIRGLNKLSGVRYRLAGTAISEYLSALESCDGWRNVDYLGKIKFEQVEAEYKSSIAGMALNYCSQIKGEGTLGNTKLFETMAAARPVICTDYRLWKEIVEKYNCGIAINPHDVDAIASAIQYFIDNPDIAEKMGQNGRRAIEEEFNWYTQEKVLLRLYEILLGE